MYYHVLDSSGQDAVNLAEEFKAPPRRHRNNFISQFKSFKWSVVEWSVGVGLGPRRPSVPTMYNKQSCRLKWGPFVHPPTTQHSLWLFVVVSGPECVCMNEWMNECVWVYSHLTWFDYFANTIYLNLMFIFQKHFWALPTPLYTLPPAIHFDVLPLFVKARPTPRGDDIIVGI